MKLNYNLQGAARKNLVEAASNILGWTPIYKKAPTFAYAIANYIIDKNGVLTGPDSLDLEDALHQAGFDAESREYDEPDTYESGLGGMDALPNFEDLNKTEGEELGLGQERRDSIGENGMQASDCPEPEATEAQPAETKPDKRGLPRLYTIDTRAGRYTSRKNSRRVTKPSPKVTENTSAPRSERYTATATTTHLHL